MLTAPRLHRARLLAAALWAVSALTIAIGAATLNAVMTDRVEFGNTVSLMFKIEAVIVMLCSVLIVAVVGLDKALDKKSKRVMYSLAFVGIAGVLAFVGLQPMLAELRASAGPGGVMASDSRRLFGLLHAAMMVVYLLQTIAAVVLVVKNR